MKSVVRSMVRPFPIIDSLLLAAAMFVISGCLSVLVGGQEADSWFYAMVLAGLVLAVLLYLGPHRGRGNVDGVFIGPVLRILAIVVLIGAGGFWVWLAASTKEVPGKLKEVPGVLGDGCRRKLEQVESMLSTLKNIVVDTPDGLADSGKFRAAYNLVDGSDRLLGTCDSSDIRDHTRRRNALLEELRVYYDTPTNGPITNIADALTRDYGKAANTKKLPYRIEKQPSSDPKAPPKVFFVFDDPVQPMPPAAEPPDASGKSAEKLPPTLSRVEYRSDLRSDLLGILLGGFGFSWGSAKITVEKVERAVAEAAKQNSGKPLENLIEDQKLTPFERNAFVQKLIELAYLEDATGSGWGNGVMIYIGERLETALCLALGNIDRSFMVPARPDLNELLKRRANQSPQERIETDAKVRDCILDLAGNQSQQILDRYKSFVSGTGG